jgi:Flp pilus assembly protein CpaB
MFVLGVDSRLSGETREEAELARGRSRPSITLLATPDQAEQIAHAELLGDLRMVLRNSTDLGFAEVDGVDLDDLRRRLTRTPTVIRAAPSLPEPRCMELAVILGEERVVQLVDEHGVPCR